MGMPEDYVNIKKRLKFVKPGEIIEESWLKEKLASLEATYKNNSNSQKRALKLMKKLKKKLRK